MNFLLNILNVATTLIMDEGNLAVKVETTEGTYVAESAAESFLEVLAEGFEITPTREGIERNIRSATVESEAGRVGTKAVTGSVPVEFKAGATEGAAPRADALYRALLGGKRQLAGDITTQTGHTDTVLEIDDTNGTAQVQTATFETKANTDSGDFIVLRAKDGTVYAAAADLTGSDSEPTSSKWLGIASARKVMVDISGDTTAAEVAASFEVALDALTGFTADIVTDDSADDGTMIFTWQTSGVIEDDQGLALDPSQDYAAASEIDESSGISFANTTPGVNSDIQKLKLGDTIYVEESGAGHISPIFSKDSDSITLLVGKSGGGNFSDGVVIRPFTTYYHDAGNAPTLSLTNYIGNEVREKAIGCRVLTGELAGYSTGQLPTMAFAIEGLDFARALGQPLYTPSFDSILPPIILKAKVYKDGVEQALNEFTLSIANTLGFKTSTASDNGKIASRITNQAITGTINPYMENTDVNNFNDLFVANETFSIFAHGQNDASVSGEYENMFGIYLPYCKLPELSTGDVDGLSTDAFAFAANKSSGKDSVFISFS